VSKQNPRREFLKFLAASPYVASLGGVAAFLRQGALAQGAQEQVPGGIANPAAALDVFDFEDAAHRRMEPGHWAFVRSGVDDDATLRANREAFQHIELRPRRLHDATKVDMRVDLFGATYDSPIFACPTGGAKTFNPDGELAIARAAKARGALQFLSTGTSISVEEVNAARGRPVWYQLYAPLIWEACEQMLRRVEAAGCTVIALTVDQVGRNSETYMRSLPKDMSRCNSCHQVTNGDVASTDHPMRDGLPTTGARLPFDWAFADRIRKTWKGKFIMKGMETREDARLCIEHGIDGILVSNHGARSVETGRATIEALPEVVAEVKGRIPVFVDGGFRRGTDVFKALALGATAVGVGRPILWGLGSFGQAGVDRVLEILQAELKMAMGNCGTRTVADITRAYVATPDWNI
jgi:isopentenyl diphosphate isomerase/L-lactate dehydrogenase-like FMN-dependent dehydrogenase